MRSALLSLLAIGAIAVIPAAAARADTIAYNCGTDICLINPDNTAQHSNLTETPAGAGQERSPSWSPDGGRIAYVGAYGGWWDVFVIDATKSAAESEATNISDNQEASADTENPPVWSADGTRVAYTENWNSSEKTGFDVFVSPFDGSSKQVAIGQTKAGENFPSWLPDGRLVFSRNALAYVGNADGSGTPAAIPGSNGYRLAASPDGRYVAMESTGSYPYRARIVKTDGSGSYLLAKEANLGPDFAWSADSTRVAYINDEEPSGGSLDQIWVAPADGSSPGNAVPMPPGWIVPHNPSFSPDGTRVAFNARPSIGAGYEQILVGPADGSAPAVPITNGAYSSEEPDWKPGPGAPKPPVTGGGGAGAGGSGGGAAKVPVKIRLAYIKNAVTELRYMTISWVDCHAQGGRTTRKIAEFCAAQASAYPSGGGRATGFRPLLAGASAKRKPPLFAQGKVKVPVGGKRQLKLKVTAAGRKLLRTGKPVKLRLSLKLSQPGERPQSITKTLTVQLPKPKKKPKG